MLLLKTCLFITHGKHNTTVQKQETIIIAPTWNNESKLPYGSYSMSDIQDYVSKNKKH